MIVAALVVVVIGVGLIRWGWSGRRGAAGAGWLLAAAALVMLAARNGAWGIAVGAVVGIAAALVLVLYAGWTSPAKVSRAGREAPSITLPRRWHDLRRRVVVFMLVVPIAFCAAQWLAFGAQAIARRAGANDADTMVLTLMLQPILWALLIAWQMTRASPARMVAPPAAAVVLGTVLWCAS
ncbi:Ca2+/Na+ antiporter [Sphingomonas insulae]|uniref:MFS transporter n=1 Tax=Sphingomonas insulae TaxID=424800 RepID=A0ABN1I015_9SPHN|nr:hypothetical protein [Sphingomonas insulae]NIJ30650.1 Ca2+/Na+ antiporter [Sphingomonas insulae]